MSIRTVYVEVVSCGTENEEENDTYAIKIQSSVDSSDMKQVKDQLKTKNKALSDALNAGEISFKREGESVKLKGRWLRLGEDSPLKDEVLIKACLRPRNLMKSFESDATKGTILSFHSILLILLYVCDQLRPSLSTYGLQSGVQQPF